MKAPRPLLVLLASLVLLLFLLWDALHVQRMLQVHLNDFGRFWYGAQAWAEGGSLYQTTVATPVDLGERGSLQLHNLGTPSFHLLLLPLIGLGERGAIALWSLVGLLGLAWSFRAIQQELQLRPDPTALLLAALALAAFAGTAAQLVTGQLAWILLAPITAAWRAARRDRWLRAAATLGLITALKPLFALFAPWLLLRGRLRGGLGFAGGLVGALLAGGAVFGAGSWIEWSERLGGVSWSWLPMNGSIHGALTRLLSEDPFFPAALDAPDLVQPLWLVASALVGLAAAAGVWRAGTDRAMALLLCAALLISPLAWVYYHLLLLPPLLALWRDRPPGPALRTLLVVAFVTPFAATALFRDQPLLVATLGAPYLWGTLALFLSLLRPPAPGPASGRSSRSPPPLSAG